MEPIFKDAPARLARERLKLLLHDADLVEKYLSEHGPELNVQHLKAIRKSRHKSLQFMSGEGEDPTYTITVKCPVCKHPDIPCYELRSKSQAVTYDRFLVPRYEGAKGYRTVNFSMISVTVCPRCLFSSPDKKDFVTKNIQTGQENKSQLGPLIIKQLQEGIAQRRAMLGRDIDPDTFFKVPRSLEAAVTSYELAEQRSVVEAEFDMPYSHYKAGMYLLKVAMLTRDNGEDDAGILAKAMGHLEKSFTRSEAKALDVEAQIAYVVAAIALRLGKIDKYQAFLSGLDKVKTDALNTAKSDPRVKPQAVDGYVKKAKDLWVDRENPDLWKH